MEAIRAENERLRVEAERRAAEMMEELAVNLEPTAKVESSIDFAIR